VLSSDVTRWETSRGAAVSRERRGQPPWSYASQRPVADGSRVRFAGIQEVVGAKLKEVAGRETPGAPRNGEPLKRRKPKRAFGSDAV
jgi:hypothetical protein